MNCALLAALKESASTRRALAVSSCLQAALAERSDGSERSEAKQKSSPPFFYNLLSPMTREVAALRVDLSGAYAPYFLSLVFLSYESWRVNLKICA